MRALRVVGITEGDGELSVVVEDPGRRERFTVPADEQLRAAARGDLTRLGQIAIELESQLRPREIQARIRAGASVEQVAAAAGVPPQRIERFAYPVLLERSKTAEVAQRAHPVRSDGPDGRMLGDVVAHTFGLRGQEYPSAEWDSWKGEDGRWIVALSWRAGRSDNCAHWTFQPGADGGTVTAVDENAHDLVEGLPAGPLRTVGPVIDLTRPDEPEPAGEPAPERGQLRATASDVARAPWSGELGRVGTERPPTRTAPEPRRPESSRRTDTGRPAAAHREDAQRGEAQAGEPREPFPAEVSAAVATRREAGPAHTPPSAPAGSASATGSDVSEASVPAVAAANVAVPDVAEPDVAVPDVPAPDATGQATDDQSPAEPATSPRRTRKGKPVMPSWDEVLLGVRGQR